MIFSIQVFNFNKMIPEEHYKLVFQITCVFQKWKQRKLKDQHWST